jgi:hypothetical protein
MRVVFACLALMFFSGAAVAQPKAVWTVQAGPIGGYFVDFPGKPIVQQSNEGVRNGKPLISYLQGVELDGGRTFLAVSSTDMGNGPKDDSERDAVLANVRNSIVNSNPTNKLISTAPVVVSGVTGVDFIFDVPAHQARIRHRLFIAGSKLVQQMISGAPGTETSPDAVRFANSLRLTP